MNLVKAILDDNYVADEDQTLSELVEALGKSKQAKHKATDVINTLELNPYQTDFLTSPDRGFEEVLYSGAVGAGKSLLLSVALIRYVSIPNTPVLLCRYNLSDLKKSTLKTLLESETQKDGSVRPPLLPVQTIKSYNKTEGIIYLHNGSQIILCGVADVEKIRSINCAAAFCEEVSEFTEEMWTAVQQRCRVPCKLPNVVMAATNPKHKGHFLYRRLFIDSVKTRRVITVSAYSNKHLSDAYIRQLESLPEPERTKMLFGEWVDIASSVFPMFRRTHVRDCSNMPTPGAFESFLVAQDYGGGAGYCGAVLLGVGRDGLIYCLEELYKKSQTHGNMLAWMEQYRDLSNSTMVYDSANAALKLDMENAGWKCIPCIKDIEGSIGIVNDRMNSNTLVISSKCTNLIEQLEGASRDPKTGLISKLKNWDVIDAYRYGICALTTTMKRELTPETGMLYFIP